MSTPELKVYREANQNVVIKSGDFAARFHYNYGGALLEFWKDNFPIILDPWPGSGNVNVIDGQTQDLSQTSPDGITPYTLKNNVYLQDYVTSRFYQTAGYLPCFWLSHEAIDDLQATGPAVWATPYQLIHKWGGGASIAFVPYGNSITKSMIFPKDTLGINGNFTNDITKFRNSLVSAKTKVFLRNADSDSYGGIVFRYNPYNMPANPSHSQVINQDHYSFQVFKNGQWSLRRNGRFIKHGNISTLQRMRLRNNTGLEIEVRTLPDVNSRVQLLIEGKIIHTATLPTTHLEVGAGLIASTRSGKVEFDTRTFIDTSIRCVATYTPTIDRFGVPCIDHDVHYYSMVNEPYTMYRAGGGSFLNPFTFPIGNRSTGYLDGLNKWVEYDGLLRFYSAKAFYAGTKGGELGLTVVPLLSTINDVDQKANGQAHALVSKLQINNSFVIMFNTQRMNGSSEMSGTRLILRYYNFRNSNPDNALLI